MAPPCRLLGAKSPSTGAFLTKKGDCRLTPNSLGCYWRSSSMSRICTNNRPYRSEQAKCFPLAASSACSDSGTVRLKNLFSFLCVRSSDGQPQPHLPPDCRKRKTAEFALRPLPDRNSQAVRPLRQKPRRRTPRDSGTGLKSLARRMNCAHFLPIVSLQQLRPSISIEPL